MTQASAPLPQFIDKYDSLPIMAADLRMCIPTRVVSPAVTSTAGFLRANIARMSKVYIILCLQLAAIRGKYKTSRTVHTPRLYCWKYLLTDVVLNNCIPLLS